MICDKCGKSTPAEHMHSDICYGCAWERLQREGEPELWEQCERLSAELKASNDALLQAQNAAIDLSGKLGTLEFQLKNLSEHAAGFAAERNAALRRLDSLRKFALNELAPPDARKLLDVLEGAVERQSNIVSEDGCRYCLEPPGSPHKETCDRVAWR